MKTITYLRPRQVAERLSVSMQTVRNAVREGKLPAIQKRAYNNRKGAILIAEPDVERWLAKDWGPVARVNSGDVGER